MKKSSPQFLLGSTACAVLLALVSSLLILHTTSVSAASLSQRHTLPGHVIEAFKGTRSIHATDKTKQLHLSISLNLRNRPGLDTLIKEQNDPNSASYHQYLTPQQFKDAFSPTQATLNNVVAYLKEQGLRVTSVAPNNALVNASGSVATVEQAFGVTLNDYQLNGRTVYAPTTDPSVPDTLGNTIATISGLNNIPLRHHAVITQQNKQASTPSKGYTPAQLRAAYNVTSLLSNGGTGAGQTTALFELDGYKPSDVTTYLNTYHLGTPKFSDVLVDDATNTPGPGAIEVELDMEVMSALAPDAAQKIYIGPNSLAGINDTYTKIVTDDLAKVTSISWGLCEYGTGSSELIALDNIFAQGAAQGQAFFAASGDAGAYDCQGAPFLSVDSPASDPHVVGVGGTTLQLASNGGYGSESAWSNTTVQNGGGGGISALFTRPAYQSGPNLTNANRQVPDISANADPGTGYSIYCTIDDPICTNSWTEVGGTSAAAPLWAALATDTNEYLAHQKKPGLGSASASLYALYTQPQPYSAYHDVTSGDNLYYKASTGYDMATGIGTPDAWNFARDLKVLLTPPNTGPTQLLKNANFDLSTQSWTTNSTGGYDLVTTTNPHAGGFSADLCGYATCNDRLSQTVTLPTNAQKVVLSYWAYVNTNQTKGRPCIDAFASSLRTSRDTAIIIPQVLCNTQAAGWKHFTFDVTVALAQYGGQPITLAFRAITGPTTATEFFVDDVALNVTRH